MNLYLENISLENALEKYLSVLPPFATQTKSIPVAEALGRITAEPVFATNNSPMYDCAAMDGIAVVSEKTAAARDISPVTLSPGVDFMDIDTGDPVKPPYDAVIMVEDIQRTEDGVVIRKAAPACQHVRAIGEDVVKGEMIIPSNHKIRPVDIGAMLSGGVVSVLVKSFPKVTIIPTGSELVEAGSETTDGSIIESNSHMLAALVQEDGAKPHRLPIVPDDYELLKKSITEAIKNSDMVLICSGTSAGREDYTKPLLASLGEVIVHGIAIKPGKPAILAIVDGKPVIGIPGYPVSAYIVYKNIVSKLLRQTDETTIEATLTKRLVSSIKHKEFVRVKLGKIDDKFIATPLARGAGSGMSLVRADGFCVIPQALEGIEAGETVSISLLCDVSVFAKSVISIGSHDIIMDILADMLGDTTHLSSSHVGTMGGLMALKRNECHIAPIHHLDEASGTYNIEIVQKLFPKSEQKMAIIKGVERVQGLMVQKGNPLEITGIEDLARVKYVNRSRGTGTRLFLDYQLKLAGILPENISGYYREAATHMQVGGITKSGGADAGLGVMSAALACGLDFIPIGVEAYDFAIHAKNLDNGHIKHFIAALKSQNFAKKLQALGGYTAKHCGEVILL